MPFRFALLAVLILSFLTGTAQAQDYAKPSWPNLVRTMVRFNALDLSDQTMIDEYAIITECDLYKSFHANDFKWNQVRNAVHESVQMNVASFPMNYHYDIKMQLDRYDFNSKVFSFTEKSKLRNVNTFVLYWVEGTGCGVADVKYIPRIFRAVLATPIYLEGLPLSEKDARMMLERMEKENNSDRIIYARFNLRIVYIDPLRKETGKVGAGTYTRYGQSNMPDSTTVRFDTRLDSINFYEDPEMTKLIYEYSS